MSAKLGQTLEYGDTSGHQVERLDFIVEIDASGSLSSRFFRNGERDTEREHTTGRVPGVQKKKKRVACSHQ